MVVGRCLEPGVAGALVQATLWDAENDLASGPWEGLYPQPGAPHAPRRSRALDGQFLDLAKEKIAAGLKVNATTPGAGIDEQICSSASISIEIPELHDSGDRMRSVADGYSLDVITAAAVTDPVHAGSSVSEGR